MTQHLIKVFGERNTGTRAILQMIRALPHLTTNIDALAKPQDIRKLNQKINDRLRGKSLRQYSNALEFDNKARVGGVAAWKHAAPKFDASFIEHDAKVILAVKNPYSWLLSLAKRPYHSVGRPCRSMEQFIDFPWLTSPKDAVASVVTSPMILWNEKLRAYLALERADLPVSRLMFEAFVDDPVKSLWAALVELGVDPAGLSEIPQSTKEPERSLDDVKNRYQNQKWRAYLSRQSVALINQYTDWNIAEQFGYQMLDPKDFPIDLPASAKEKINVDLKLHRIKSRN